MSTRRILDILFVWSGTKFFLEWLLPTNPTSKNPIIKHLYGFMKSNYTATKYEDRFALAVICFIFHIVAFFVFWAGGNNTVSFWCLNILTNVYPVFVQVYIGYRTFKIAHYKHCTR